MFRISTPNEYDSSLLNTIKRIHTDFVQYENSSDKLHILREKLNHMWLHPQLMSNPAMKDREGYRIVEYLEQSLAEQTMNEKFFIFIIHTLSKNEHFYQLLLQDHTRFESLFYSTSHTSVHLMRFVIHP